MSVRDNIRFARRDAGDEDVESAATVGNAHEFVAALPDRYDTDVSRVSLSVRQKQRICVSRAVLANCPILLLDEGTASLDAGSEALVQQSLEEFRRGRTTIIVARRLATVKRAHRILVLRDGHLVESGSHEQLLRAHGVYADLVRFHFQ
jgi:ABC-type multidrug transport system fused ATPase/permease subunit